MTMDPNHIPTRLSVRRLAHEVSSYAHIQPAEVLTPEWDDLPYNEQVGRFVLLYFLMKQAGLCKGEVRNFLSKYLHTLSDSAFQQLKLHLPRIHLLHKKDFDFELSLEGIQQLGPKHGPRRNIPTIVLFMALNLARIRASCDPLRFYGVGDGWFLWLASDLSRRSVFLDGANGRVFSHKKDGFWFGELENAVWLGIVSRLALLAPDDEYLANHGVAIREAWRGFFGDFSNNNRSCTCQDRRNALPDGDYDKKINPRDAWRMRKFEVHLRQVLKALDAFGTPVLTTEEDGGFEVSELYSTTAANAFPVYQRVFELHYSAELWEVLNRLPGLTERTSLEIVKREIKEFDFSKFPPAEPKVSQPKSNPKAATAPKPAPRQPKVAPAPKMAIPVQPVETKKYEPESAGWTTVTHKTKLNATARQHRAWAHR